MIANFVQRLVPSAIVTVWLGALAAYSLGAPVDVAATSQQFSPGIVNPSFAPFGVLIDFSQYGLNDAVVLANGQILLTPSLERLNADGTVDATFQAAAVLVAAFPNFAPSSGGFSLQGQVIQQGDGKLVMVVENGNGTYVRAVRFNPNGTLDQTFAVDPALLTWDSVLAPAVNGGFLLFSANTSLSWTLLDSVGSATGPTQSLPLPNAVYLQTPLYPVVANADNHGNVWVAVNAQKPNGSIQTVGLVYAFSPLGSLLPGFNQGTIPNGEQITRLVPYGDGMYVTEVFGLDAAWTWNIDRLNRDGFHDTTWLGFNGGFVSIQEPSRAFAFNADGSIVVLDHVGSAGPDASAYQLVRIEPSGARDLNFGAFILCDGVPQFMLPTAPSNSYLIGGSFGIINGLSFGGLAELSVGSDYTGTRLANFSNLDYTSGAGQPLMAGISVSGSGTRQLLLRASGPALAQFGIAGTVADPTVTFFQNGAPIGFDDNWGDGGSAASVTSLASAVGAFPFSAGSSDAALVESVGTGNYLLQAGSHGMPGTALAEVYDASPAPVDFNAARVKNFSALCEVSANAPVATAGFSIAGTNARELLIRAVGPTLANFGIGSALADPTLAVYFAGGSPDAGSLALVDGSDENDLAVLVGAFPLNNSGFAGDQTALGVFPAGSYTIQVGSRTGQSGTVLIEVYELP